MAEPFATIDPGTPILLLPVRLETLVRADGDPAELLVRIYPDNLHLHSHEPRLSHRELRAGQAYWIATWRAGSDPAAQARAWRGLHDAFGGPRAAWVSERLRPLNPDDRPADPVPTGQPLPAQPRFPDPPVREDDDTTPVASHVLPDRWIVLGYGAGTGVFVHAGNPVPDPLPAGLQLATDDDGDDNDGDIGDIGAPAWLTDFDAAVEAGMAAHIRLPAAALSRVDTLLVLGSKESVDRGEAARRLADLLDSHRFTSGLALLPPGVATNNSAEARAGDRGNGAHGGNGANGGNGAGDGQPAPTGPPGPAFSEGDGSDGDRTARALGVGAPALDRVPGAAGRGDENAAAMSTALWATTWGYYLEQIIRLVPEDRVAAARRFFVDHVRGRGPFPTLRVGRQPYGLLPVTSLARWRVAPGEPDDRPMVDLLRTLLPVWRASLDQVPRLPGAERPDRALLEVLGMQPTSVSYGARSLLGPSYLRHLDAFVGLHLDEQWWERQDALAARPLADLGITARPWLLHAVWAPQRRPVVLPPVAVDEYGDEYGDGSAGYMRRLGSLPYRALRDAEPDIPTLLGRLVRHGLLLEYVGAAQRILVQHGLLDEQERVELELVNIAPDDPTATVWDQLNQVVPGVTPGQTLGEFLDGDLTGTDDPAVADLRAARAALEQLAEVPVHELELLLPETLDCASHRLDAWVTGLAARRLERLRTGPGAVPGVAVGGYGWLTGDGLLGDRSAPQPAGFVHAPSLGQAATAGVLRAGRDTHLADGTSLSIDLSSRRARAVRWLLDGVSAGQPLAALLGYRFERGLHEEHPGLELDRYVQPVRDLAPLVRVGQDTGGAGEGGPVEALAARNVVDGLRLHRRWQAGEVPFGSAGLPQVGTPEQSAIVSELRRLDDLVDALADATLAESVHHLVQGDTARAEATLAALGRGEAVPPELQVLETPRTGIGVTHRLLVLLPPPAGPPDGWPTGERHVRARTEPRLDAWAATLLGDPRRIRCRAGFVDDAGDWLDPAGPGEVSLRDLALSPLDVLYAGGTAGSAADELEQRVRRLVAASQSPDVPPGAAVRVELDRAEQWPSEVVSFTEALALVRTARSLLSAARPVAGQDVAAPGRQADSSVDAAELAARVDGAVAAVQAVRDGLADAAPDQPDTVADLLSRATLLGVSGAVPETGTEGRQAQVVNVLAELDRRLAELAGLDPVDPAVAGVQAAVGRQVARGRAALGADFRILPLVTPPPADRLGEAFADDPGARDDDPLAAVAWVQRIARVRPAAGRLTELLTCAEALGSGSELGLRVAQLPFQPGERWVALPWPAGQPVPAGRVSLVAPRTEGLDETVPLAGLHVDEWQEVVPGDRETTGVAVGYDQPGSRAPQAMLLAVAPDPAAGWDLSTVADVALETLDLARLRTVDPDARSDLGHYLPAACLATNVRNATVSSRLTQS